MIVPAAIGAGVGYVRAKSKTDRGRAAVKGALWGVGIAFIAGLVLLAAASGKDQLGLFKGGR